MNYLICQDWSNTSGNHAGMKHMCSLLIQKFPEHYDMIVVPDFYSMARGTRRMKRIQCYFMRKILVPAWYWAIGYILSKKIHEDDSVFLLEYLELMYPQVTVARSLKLFGRCSNIYALVHLVPDKITASFSTAELMRWASYVRGFWTFGSSLTKFLRCALPSMKSHIHTAFHYVDLDYYHPRLSDSPSKDDPVRVIAMGNQKRNFLVLRQVVESNPHVRFTICQGVMDLRNQFSGYTNVDLVGFIDESELLGLMQESDISLNVMEDTIGSNVIVTSMAVGMALINSDVGSIRDYCDDSCALFCKNEDPHSFSNALTLLVNDRERLSLMKRNSFEKSQDFSIMAFHGHLKSHFREL